MLFALFVALTASRVFTAPLWGDELRTWRDGIEKPLIDVVTWHHNNDHAPLGHLLARGGAAIFGVDHAWSLRLGAWLCALACVPAIWRLGRTLDSDAVGLLMAALLVVDPNIVFQSTQARMYPPLLLASILALTAAARLFRFTLHHLRGRAGGDGNACRRSRCSPSSLVNRPVVALADLRRPRCGPPHRDLRRRSQPTESTEWLGRPDRRRRRNGSRRTRHSQTLRQAQRRPDRRRASGQAVRAAGRRDACPHRRELDHRFARRMRDRRLRRHRPTSRPCGGVDARWRDRDERHRPAHRREISPGKFRAVSHRACSRRSSPASRRFSSS